MNKTQPKKKRSANKRISILFGVTVFSRHVRRVSPSHFTRIYNRHLDSLNRHCVAFFFLSSFGECYTVKMLVFRALEQPDAKWLAASHGVGGSLGILLVSDEKMNVSLRVGPAFPRRKQRKLLRECRAAPPCIKTSCFSAIVALILSKIRGKLGLMYGSLGWEHWLHISGASFLFFSGYMHTRSSRNISHYLLEVSLHVECWDYRAFLRVKEGSSNRCIWRRLNLNTVRNSWQLKEAWTDERDDIMAVEWFQ